MNIIPKTKTVHCKYCGKVSSDLSHRKICPECGISRMLISARQIRDKKGFFYQKWKNGMLDSISEKE